MATPMFSAMVFVAYTNASLPHSLRHTTLDTPKQTTWFRTPNIPIGYATIVSQASVHLASLYREVVFGGRPAAEASPEAALEASRLPASRCSGETVFTLALPLHNGSAKDGK